MVARPQPAVQTLRGPVQPLSYWSLFVTKGGLRIVVFYLSLLFVFFLQSRKPAARTTSASYSPVTPSCKKVLIVPTTYSTQQQQQGPPLHQAYPDISLIIAPPQRDALDLSLFHFPTIRILARDDCSSPPSVDLEQLHRDYPLVDTSLLEPSCPSSTLAQFLVEIRPQDRLAVVATPLTLSVLEPDAHLKESPHMATICFE